MNQNTNRPYQNTNRPYQNTNGPYQNTNKHYQNTNNAFSKYQRRKFIIPTLKFIISKYQQPYQNTNRPYDHVQNTNTSNSPFQNTNSPTKIPTDPMIEVGALRHFLSDFRQDCHPSWWKFRWIAWIGENWGDEIVTKFGDTLGDDFVTYCFTQYGDFFGELPEMVRIKVTKM